MRSRNRGSWPMSQSASTSASTATSTRARSGSCRGRPQRSCPIPTATCTGPDCCSGSAADTCSTTRCRSCAACSRTSRPMPTWCASGTSGPSSLYGQYDDHKTLSFDFGYRRYVPLDNGKVRLFGEATVGIAFIDEIDVLLAAPEANLVLDQTDFYDQTAAFTLGASVGVLFPVADEGGSHRPAGPAACIRPRRRRPIRGHRAQRDQRRQCSPHVPDRHRGALPVLTFAGLGQPGATCGERRYPPPDSRRSAFNVQRCVR